MNRPQPGKSGSSKSLHGNGILIGEAGILIRGPSGSGKSTLSLRLISTVRQMGCFSCLIGDDRLEIHCTRDHIIMRPHPAIAGKLEMRWLGIKSMPIEPAAVIHAVVDLSADAPPRLPEPDQLRTRISHRDIPCLTLPQGLEAKVQVDKILHFLNFGLDSPVQAANADR